MIDVQNIYGQSSLYNQLFLFLRKYSFLTEFTESQKAQLDRLMGIMVDMYS